MKKGKLIQLRISEREKSIIQEKATAMEMSISDYIRYVAISKKVQAKKVDLSKMQECILDVNYWFIEEDGQLFFADNENKYKLKEDIRKIVIYQDKQKGYFLEDGRSLREVTEH